MVIKRARGCIKRPVCCIIWAKNAEVQGVEPLQYEERGYLKEPFRLFHLADGQHERIEYHYHTFHKIIILLAGQAGYAIEGERYDLTPGDFVLVGRGSIHRPEVARDAFYERMILYILPAYLASLSTADCDLEECFRQAQTAFRYVYRDEGGSRVRQLFQELAETVRQGGYGAALLERAQFLELMVEVNRVCRGGHQVQAAAGDSKVVALLQYLSLHLTEELSIDQLAQRFYISKYHMMRRFRQETGYSIHGYLTEKRLLLAQRLLAQGTPPSEAGLQAGYQDYSTFSRAYKKQFGHGPSADVTRQHDLQ